jgi:Flp pilus assembly protein TadG
VQTGPPALSSPKLLRDESGAALVEFALVLPLVLVLLLGLMDFGRAFNHWIDSTHLANVAARYAAVNRNPGAAEGLTLQEYVQQRASTEELRNGSGHQTPVEIRICVASTNVGDPVTVKATSTWQWLDFLLGRVPELAPDTQIQGSATMRLEAKPTNFTPDQVGGC